MALLGGINLLSAQDVLSLEDAIATALERNYSIRIQKYAQQSAENNVYPGGAGLLPSLTLGANGQYNNNNARVDVIGVNPTTGQTEIQRQEANGVQTGSAGASATLSYTLALGNFRRFDVLKSSLSLSEEQTRQVLESVSLSVAVSYYNLARISNRLEIQRRALENSRTQLDAAKTRQTFGGSNRLAVLNAQVNVQSDSINLVTSQAAYDNAARDFNTILGVPVEEPVIVDGSMTFAELADVTSLQEAALAQSSSLAVADASRKLSELNLRVSQAQRLPTLSVNGSYGYNYSNNGPFSFAPELQTWGLSAGASLNFNLFNGFQTSRQIQSAEIDLASTRERYREVEQTLVRDITKAYANYESNKRVLALNQTSLEAATLNYERTQEAFKLGQATSVELRQAQLNLQQVENQLNELRFDIKLNELELLQLSGQFVSEEGLLEQD